MYYLFYFPPFSSEIHGPPPCLPARARGRGGPPPLPLDPPPQGGGQQRPDLPARGGVLRPLRDGAGAARAGVGLQLGGQGGVDAAALRRKVNLEVFTNSLFPQIRGNLQE